MEATGFSGITTNSLSQKESLPVVEAQVDQAHRMQGLGLGLQVEAGELKNKIWTSSEQRSITNDISQLLGLQNAIAFPQPSLTTSFVDIISNIASWLRDSVQGFLEIFTKPSEKTLIPRGSPLKKTKQLFWKPVSSADGNVVVYLPQNLGKAKSVKILSPDRTSVIESGTYSGKTGAKRAQYRFSKNGEGYPDGAIVQIERKDGRIREVVIKNPKKLTRH